MKGLLVSLCLLLTVNAMNATPKKTSLNWCSPDFPPYFIQSGELKAKGVNDQIIKYLQDKLPQYQHKLFNANPARVIFEMEKGQDLICTALFKTPEREKSLLFSQSPLFLVHPNHLIILKKDRLLFAPYINHDGEIDLQKLQSSDLSLGIAAKRVYTGKIDEFIANFKVKDQVTQTSGSNIYGNLLKMLTRNRIDFTFGYPIETSYVAQQEGINNIFDVVPVKGMAKSYGVYVGAPKTKWGEKVLADVEAVYNSKPSIETFSDFYAEWLDAKTKLRYQQQVNFQFEGLFNQ